MSAALSGPPATPDYRQQVTYGLLLDVTALLAERGIGWADDEPRRRARALTALCSLADAMAGEM